MKVIEKMAALAVRSSMAPMHVEQAVCRAEAVEHSGRRRDAMDLLGEMRPGCGDEAVDVKVVEDACARPFISGLNLNFLELIHSPKLAKSDS